VTWNDFYLFCFFFGFFFSAVAVATGHLGLNTHDGSGVGVDADMNVHGGDHAAHSHASPFNMATIAAFLAWFGGTGYLATRYYGLWFVTAFGLAITSGVVGAGVVFWFLSKVLMREREEMDPALYEMIGVLGSVSSAIRSDGIGEVLYSRDGARHAVPARSEDGKSIPSGVEVVVTRYENGIAYVQEWDDFAGPAGLNE
jgi:membrane protein implicated in regulation of membrane protease activity